MKSVSFFVAVVVGLFVAGCESGTCDRVARVSCDNAASTCINNCPDSPDSAYLACFETQCQPALCTCLEAVGCAYEDPNCDVQL